MITAPKVYDWPSQIVLSSQLFHAGGQIRDGGFTSSGARVGYPEPGGRSFLEMEFPSQRHGPTDTLISWLMSRISNGNLFRVPIGRSVQVLSDSDLGLSGGATGGLLWAAEGLVPARPWDGGNLWAYEPGAVAAAAALEGVTELSIDVGSLPSTLNAGHVFGIDDTAYLVDDIDWDGSIATIKIDPPLRADLSEDDFITFRPKMIGFAVNPESFRANYGSASTIRPGPVTMMEALL
jgi:hypothetical protein